VATSGGIDRAALRVRISHIGPPPFRSVRLTLVGLACTHGVLPQLAPAAFMTSAGPSAEQPIHVVLADDHALVRRGLRLLLDREEGVKVVAEAEDLTTVIRHVHDHRPHVLVLDLGMPDGSSIEMIRRLREEVPSTEIVVLTTEDSPGFAQQTLDAGAIGFVLKDSADAELNRAVRATARGEQYVSPRVTASLESLRRAMSGDALTAREAEVLRLIALGHTSAGIGRKLHLSRRTVETHRARLHRKLGMSTRAELVRYALQRGLLAV
jgi:two-component system response regulator NreC